MRSLSRSAGKSVKRFLNNRYSIVILLLVVVGGYLLYNWCQKNKLEFFSGEATLHFFFAEWCGYCKKFKPEWERLKAETNLGVKLNEVDCSDNNNVPELAKKYNVNGFPTIIFVNGNNTKTYEGARTKEALVSFIKQNQ